MQPVPESFFRRGSFCIGVLPCPFCLGSRVDALSELAPGFLLCDSRQVLLQPFTGFVWAPKTRIGGSGACATPSSRREVAVSAFSWAGHDAFSGFSSWKLPLLMSCGLDSFPLPLLVGLPQQVFPHIPATMPGVSFWSVPSGVPNNCIGGSGTVTRTVIPYPFCAALQW